MAFGGKCAFSFCLVLSCSLPPLLLSHFLFACGWRVCPCGLAGGWQRCGFDVGLVVGACAGWLGSPSSLPFFCLCFSACSFLLLFFLLSLFLFSFSFSIRVCCSSDVEAQAGSDSQETPSVKWPHFAIGFVIVVIVDHCLQYAVYLKLEREQA